MKIRLPVKIFLAFLVVSIASVGMVVIANHYFSERNFESYLQFKGMKTLGVFAGKLADFYKRHGSWELLTKNAATWESLIEENWPRGEQLYSTTGTDTFLNSDASVATEIAVSALPPPPPSSQNWRLYPHITLFDAEKKLIAGEQRAFTDTSTLPISIGENTVGWVGLAFGEEIAHPLDVEFMKKQSRVFLTIGAVVILVAVAIAFFLTKHLLAPIKRLTDATEALGDRNFEIRIPVVSKDELGALALRFNAMAQKLQTYERNQRQWLSDISHELRTPLSVLIGEITALQEGIREPDAVSLSSLCDEARHLSKIVEDLHYLSLSEAGIAPMEMERMKPLPVLSQAIYFFRNRLDQNGISIDVHLDPASADLEMRGDRDRLMQLFTNLLENTLNHTNKPGAATIRQTRANGQLEITFEDTSPGVPEHALPRLFDRLYRADSSRSRKTGSSGLGLAICKTIVENHNGKILAKNSAKGGLRIEIYLPVIELPT